MLGVECYLKNTLCNSTKGQSGEIWIDIFHYSSICKSLLILGHSKIEFMTSRAVFQEPNKNSATVQPLATETF